MTDSTILQFNIDPLPTNYTSSTPTEELDDRFAQVGSALNSLYAQVTTMGQKHAIVQQGVPIVSGAAQGDLVYWNAESGYYDKAQALLRALPGIQGASIEAPQARVEGILLTVDDTAQTGTLLCGGCYTDSNVASGMFESAATGSDYPMGVYYLSPTTAGKVTSDPGGHLRQPVLVYHGNGSFSLSLFYMAHDNHFHASELVDNWVEVEAGTYTATLPGDFGEATTSTAAVFLNGTLNTVDFGFTTSGGVQQIVYSGAADLTESGSVVVFNHFPFAYGAPVVRVIQSTDNNLTVNTANGIVTLTVHDFANGGEAVTGEAISTIQSGVYKTTPVVTSANAGAGITISVGAAGAITIHRSDMFGSLLEPDTINHNGTTVGDDGTLQYLLFPAGRGGACMRLQKYLTDVPASAVLKVAASLYGSGGLSSAAVVTHFIPAPTSAASVNASGALANSSAYGVLRLDGGSTDVLTYRITSGAGLSLGGGSGYVSGTAVASITAPTVGGATIDTKCLNIGFVLN